MSLISRIIFALDAGSIFCKVALNSFFSTFGASDELPDAVLEEATGFEVALKLAASGLRFKRF